MPTPARGRAHDRELSRLSKRTPSVLTAPGGPTRPSGQAKTRIGRGLLKPQGRSAPKTGKIRRTGKQFPGT